MRKVHLIHLGLLPAFFNMSQTNESLTRLLGKANKYVKSAMRLGL